MHNKADWIKDEISDFLGDLHNNSLTSGEEGDDFASEPAWAEPLVAFAAGADPIFESYKEYVNEDHWTPAEIFSKAFPDQKFSLSELTIISWILPQTEAVKVDHRLADWIPPERWIRARVFGEKVNERLRSHVAETLIQAGISAVAPSLHPEWKIMASDKYTITSMWSERHAAHAAGLGTFGLCDGLITAKGKAMRTGSVVARVEIESTKRPYSGHRSYCLFYSQNACGDCISRCPAGALSKSGHDKLKCNNHIQNVVAAHTKKNFGFKGRGGCGLCQTSVPCESKIPVPADTKSGGKA